MKKVLFILHEYYPYGSAITNCIDPIIQEMKKKNIEVSIITRRTQRIIKKFEIIDNVKVYRINDYFTMNNSIIENSKSKIRTCYHRLIRKIIWNYKTIIKKDNDGYLNKERTIKLINKHLKNNFDTIISCSYPFKTHRIAYEIKKENNKIVWVAYQFDPHSLNCTLDENKIEQRMNEEIKILSNADKIFLPMDNYEQNIKTELNVLKEKYYPIDFPLIKEKRNNNKSKKNKLIKFAFTGTLYDNIRLPYNMLDFFRNIEFDYELNLCYITSTKISNKLKDYKKVFGKKLILNENLSKEKCDEIIDSSNIIINIGNEISNQTPSKVFEYVSYGKPIINFYSIKEDTSKKVLEKYPLKLNIYKDFTKEDMDKFNDFCNKNFNKILSFKEATKNYKTAEQVADEFIREVNKCEIK